MANSWDPQLGEDIGRYLGNEAAEQEVAVHSMFAEGYVIGNSDEVLRLYREYGVAVNFTGHLHIQHIGKEDGFCEIATSALFVSPNQYADIMLESSGLEYATSFVDVSAWAAQHRPDSAELLDFERYAGDFFWDTSYGQAAAELHDMEDGGLKDAMAGYFAGLNQIYFSGHMEEAVSEEELLEEWRAGWDYFFTAKGKDFCRELLADGRAQILGYTRYKEMIRLSARVVPAADGEQKMWIDTIFEEQPYPSMQIEMVRGLLEAFRHF